MPRPRNEKLKEEIIDAAWRSFYAKGYDATSYSGIAAQCDTTKALVQYHYPQKELLAIELMKRLLVKISSILDINDAGTAESEDFANLYRIGQGYFSFFLQEDGYSAFLFDIIRSRDLTEDVLLFNATWALDYLKRADGNTKTVIDSVIVHMGGFYELLYHCLKTRSSFDVSTNIYRVLEGFMLALGYSNDKAKQLLAPGQLSQAELERMVSELKKTMFS